MSHMIVLPHRGSAGVRGNTDVHQPEQGNGSASSNRFKAQETRTITDTSYLENIMAGLEQPSRTATPGVMTWPTNTSRK